MAAQVEPEVQGRTLGVVAAAVRERRDLALEVAAHVLVGVLERRVILPVRLPALGLGSGLRR